METPRQKYVKRKMLTLAGHVALLYLSLTLSLQSLYYLYNVRCKRQ